MATLREGSSLRSCLANERICKESSSKKKRTRYVSQLFQIFTNESNLQIAHPKWMETWKVDINSTNKCIRQNRPVFHCYIYDTSGKPAVQLPFLSCKHVKIVSAEITHSTCQEAFRKANSFSNPRVSGAMGMPWGTSDTIVAMQLPPLNGVCTVWSWTKNPPSPPLRKR